MTNRTSFQSGWRLIPWVAWLLAAAALIAIPPAIHAVFIHNYEHGFVLTFGFCLLLGVVEAGYGFLRKRVSIRETSQGNRETSG